MKTKNIGAVLNKAYNIIDSIEFCGDEDVTLTAATFNFNVDDEPYTLYYGGQGSVTVHSYNDEIEVPF